MKALVLGGGGARGAFEMGVWDVLRERNIRFDMVVGASIGALNAALYAQGDWAIASELWDTITIDQVVKGELLMDQLGIEGLLARKKDLLPILKQVASQHGADITPLSDLTHRLVSEEKLRTSLVKMGLVTVKVPSLKGVEVWIEQMNEGTVADWLLASAACFPAFPIHKVEGSGYIDGGYWDNLPIGTALSRGASEILAVDTRLAPCHPHYLDVPYLKYVHPAWSLGKPLAFERGSMDESRAMGRIQMRRALGELEGYRFAIKPGTAWPERASKMFALYVARIEAALEPKQMIGGSAPTRPISDALFWEGVPHTSRAMMVRAFELACELFSLDPLAEYDALRQIREMHGRVLADTEEGSAYAGVRTLMEALRSQNSFGIADIKKMAEKPRELATALLMHSLGMEGR